MAVAGRPLDGTEGPGDIDLGDCDRTHSYRVVPAGLAALLLVAAGRRADTFAAVLGGIGKR